MLYVYLFELDWLIAIYLSIADEFPFLISSSFALFTEKLWQQLKNLHDSWFFSNHYFGYAQTFIQIIQIISFISVFLIFQIPLTAASPVIYWLIIPKLQLVHFSVTMFVIQGKMAFVQEFKYSWLFVNIYFNDLSFNVLTFFYNL